MIAFAWAAGLFAVLVTLAGIVYLLEAALREIDNMSDDGRDD